MALRINSIIREMHTKKISEKSDYYQFGFDYFGSFLFGYTDWLVEKVRESKAEKVFFFARDGYMMKKAFDIMNTHTKIESEYVYFSRKSIRQALLWTCTDYKSSLKYLSLEKYVSLGTILEYYGFSGEDREQIAAENGLSLDKDYEQQMLLENTTIKTLYNSLRKKICDNSKEQYALLSAYLQQINMHGRCAIVDIGWHGSMQYYLEEFIRLSKLDAVLSGYYVGIQVLSPVAGITEGYLYDEHDLHLRKSALCFFGGFEKLFQSCEGSTYGYCKNGLNIEPVLAPYEYENEPEYITCIQEWQNGAIDFIKKLKEKEVNGVNSRDWAIPLIRFGKYPSLKGVKLFSFLCIMDGKKEYFVSQKGLLHYTPKEFIHALSNSVWKTGFMKSVFKLPLPYYWIYKVLRK